MRYIEVRRHTMRTRPGKHLSQAGVTLARRVGDTLGPFAKVITSDLPRAFETAIAVGFAVDEKVELLGAMPDAVVEEVDWTSGFPAFGEAYHRDGPTTRYAKKLAKYLQGVAENLPENATTLIISHGGIIEAATVGCLPDGDFITWGGYCDYCEGVRLSYDATQNKFVAVEILRLKF